MFTFFYSLWEDESNDHTFVIGLALSFYTWASGLWASIPDYTFVDPILAVWNLFHLFVALSYVTVSDAAYKKALVTIHYKITKKFYETPFVVTTAGLFLTYLSIKLSWTAYNDPNNSAAMLRAAISVNTWVAAMILQKLTNSLVKLGVDYTMKQEQQVETHDIAHWQEPPKWTRHINTPMDWILRPVVSGVERIQPNQGALYVSNHSLMGMEMSPFLTTTWMQGGVYLRGLADHFHFGQVHGEFLRYFGGVDGTRENVDTLMETQQNVLVYPGGGNEIMKPCAVPNYTLMWKERLGFVRMAVKHGYPIVPCCSVGTEDMMHRLFDIDLGFMRKGFSCPVVVLLPHKLQRVYFWYGEPIPTAQYKGDYKNDDICREVRDKVKAAVEGGIKEMQEKQAKDPNRYLFNHMGNALMGLFKRGSSTKEVTPAKKSD